MLEFIHNFGSKVFNFFSTKFGNEGPKRQGDGLTDEFSSPNKRFRLDMEPDANELRPFSASYTNFSDRYYYRTGGTLDSRRTAQPLQENMNYNPNCVIANTPRDSKQSSANPTDGNSRDLNSERVGQQMTGEASSRDSVMGGFNFSKAVRQIQDSSGFQFTANPEAVKFQGASRDRITERDRIERNVATNNQSCTTAGRSATPRLNGSDESKHRSVFSKVLGGRSGGDGAKGIKYLEPQRRNKMAVKQCVRLHEKSMYQDMLNRHMTPAQPSSYSSDWQNRSSAQPSEGSGVWGSTSLLNNRSGPLSSTRFSETPRSDVMKLRIDASTSFLTSAVSAGRGLSSAPASAYRQKMSEHRRQGQTDIPERTLQTLQKVRPLPMRAPPRDDFEKQTAVSSNRATGNSSSSRKLSSSNQSDQQQRSSSSSPITIASSEHEARRRSSRDSEVEVLTVSPEVCKANTFEKRPLMSDSFERALKESRYAKKEFLLQVNSKTQSEFAKQGILERETAVKYYKDKREKTDNQLIINQMKNLLRISERLPVPLEETFIEEEPEEEEDVVCELIEEEEEEELSGEFPELTEEQESLVSRALVPRPADQVLVEGFRLQIARKDLATLSGLNWLNDEVINFYLNLVMDRSEKQGKQGARKVYAFSTFFYPKVKSDGHKGVRRWTKSVDLFTYDYVLVPVHLGMHWCLAIVDFRKKQVRYYDSMGGSNEDCLRVLRNYLSEECQAKRQTAFDWTGWQCFVAKNIPQQLNGSDCGMFACKFAEYISRDAPITFEQRHMPYFRRRMVYEILTKTLM